MPNYLKGEIYRLLHKKSTYLYFAALALGYVLLAYIRSGGFTAESVVSDALTFFNLMPALAGGFLFAAIYLDDLNSKNLAMLVGYGLSKTTIVIAKFLLMFTLSALAFALLPLFHGAVYAVMGWAPTAGNWVALYAISLKYFLMTVAFALVSGILVYGLQRSTFSAVLYLLLAFNIVSGLSSMVLRTFAPGLSNYLMPAISDRVMTAVIQSSSVVLPLVEYTVYIAIAGVLSALVFQKKEMEF